MAPTADQPQILQPIGTDLVVVWGDGHESYYAFRWLRDHCPCASCSGEPDLFGRLSFGMPQEKSANAYQLASLERVGQYGVQLNWQDGHTWGIWTFDRLRSACSCAECSP